MNVAVLGLGRMGQAIVGRTIATTPVALFHLDPGGRAGDQRAVVHRA
jgi:3-hydroxyisobutyrate dehydrogenase-like beta-hydroxyacid dehydrogenase